MSNLLFGLGVVVSRLVRFDSTRFVGRGCPQRLPTPDVTVYCIHIYIKGAVSWYTYMGGKPKKRRTTGCTVPGGPVLGTYPVRSTPYIGLGNALTWKRDRGTHESEPTRQDERGFDRRRIWVSRSLRGLHGEVRRLTPCLPCRMANSPI